jgi:hypothetical protein
MYPVAHCQLFLPTSFLPVEGFFCEESFTVGSGLYFSIANPNAYRVPSAPGR